MSPIPYYSRLRTIISHSILLRRFSHDSLASAPVSVWWDFENCNIPVSTSGNDIVPLIRNAVKAATISSGAIEIYAIGEMSQMSLRNREALHSQGVLLLNTPAPGVKDIADQVIIDNMKSWAFHHPAPSYIFLLSGDGGFGTTLLELEGQGHRILLAGKADSSKLLLDAAHCVWKWESLLNGDPPYRNDLRAGVSQVLNPLTYASTLSHEESGSED